jgi:hypothetical protein
MLAAITVVLSRGEERGGFCIAFTLAGALNRRV